MQNSLLRLFELLKREELDLDLLPLALLLDLNMSSLMNKVHYLFVSVVFLCYSLVISLPEHIHLHCNQSILKHCSFSLSALSVSLL